MIGFLRKTDPRRPAGEGLQSALPGKGLGLLLAFWVVVTMPGGLAAQEAGRGDAPSKFSWRLSDPLVVDPGQTATTEQGTMTTGYTVEAQALGDGAAPIKRGRFRITLNAFSPLQDRPGQEVGSWQVTGTWTLTDVAAPPEAAKARYHPAVLRGTLRAKLGFNPATHAGPVKAARSTT